MTNFEILDHLIDTCIFVAQSGHYEVITGLEKALITGYSSPDYNYYRAKEPGPVMQRMIDEKIPFYCWAQEGFEENFEQFCLQKGFNKICAQNMQSSLGYCQKLVLKLGVFYPFMFIFQNKGGCKIELCIKVSFCMNSYNNFLCLAFFEDFC